MGSRKLSLAGVLALVACAGPVSAQWFHGGFTAEEMLAYCREAGHEPVRDFGRGLCAGFIDGFVAGHYVAGTWHAFHHRDEKIDQIYGRLCIPDKITRGQLARSYVLHLERNPEKLKMPAGLLLEDALREAFPCPK